MNSLILNLRAGCALFSLSCFSHALGDEFLPKNEETLMASWELVRPQEESYQFADGALRDEKPAGEYLGRWQRE